MSATLISSASVNPTDSSDEEDERPLGVRAEQLAANHAAGMRPHSSPRKSMQVPTLRNKTRYDPRDDPRYDVTTLVTSDQTLPYPNPNPNPDY